MSAFMECLKSIKRNARFIVFAHILNPLWSSREKRRNRRFTESYRRVESYLNKYRDFVKELSVAPVEGPAAESGDKIFTIWYQGEENAPELVKICFKRLRQVYGDRVVVLDRETIYDWTDFPDYIKNKWEAGLITPTHFSDICRVELLYRHGGMWFDATDYLTSPVPDWIEKSDLFIYNTGNVITPQTLIQSCFMRARKGHPLFAMWREAMFEYWRQENKLIDYFLLHYMLRFIVENNEEARKEFYAMPQIPQDPTHILWHRYHSAPYTDELYRESTKDTFFQKTNYKHKRARKPVAGSVADYIVNDKIRLPYG